MSRHIRDGKHLISLFEKAAYRVYRDINNRTDAQLYRLVGDLLKYSNATKVIFFNHPAALILLCSIRSYLHLLCPKNYDLQVKVNNEIFYGDDHDVVKDDKYLRQVLENIKATLKTPITPKVTVVSSFPVFEWPDNEMHALEILRSVFKVLDVKSLKLDGFQQQYLRVWTARAYSSVGKYIDSVTLKQLTTLNPIIRKNELLSHSLVFTVERTYFTFFHDPDNPEELQHTLRNVDGVIDYLNIAQLKDLGSFLMYCKVNESDANQAALESKIDAVVSKWKQLEQRQQLLDDTGINQQRRERIVHQTRPNNVNEAADNGINKEIRTIKLLVPLPGQQATTLSFRFLSDVIRNEMPNDLRNIINWIRNYFDTVPRTMLADQLNELLVYMRNAEFAIGQLHSSEYIAEKITLCNAIFGIEAILANRKAAEEPERPTYILDLTDQVFALKRRIQDMRVSELVSDSMPIMDVYVEAYRVQHECAIQVRQAIKLNDSVLINKAVGLLDDTQTDLAVLDRLRALITNPIR